MLRAAELSNWIYGASRDRQNNWIPSIDEHIKLPFSNELLRLAGFNLANEFLGKLATWAVTYDSTNDGCIVFVVFRGTVTVQDMIIDVSLVPQDVTNPQDINGPPLKIHSGIYLTATIDFVEILEIIDRIKRQECRYRTTKCEVIITGHSLGGGQAQALGIAYKNWLIKHKKNDITLKVFSFASPLIAWSPIKSLGLESYLKEKKDKRYRVHPNMMTEPNKALQKYIFNIVNMKDIVARLLFAIKFRYTLVNAVPNAALADILSGSKTDVVVGCKPLGQTYVIQVLREEKVPLYFMDVWNAFYNMLTDKKNAMIHNIIGIIFFISLAIYEWLYFGSFLFKQSFNNRLILNDYSCDHSWFMLEYNKSTQGNYPITIGYSNTDNQNGWSVEHHTVKYYFYNLKSCWDGETVLISDYV